MDDLHRVQPQVQAAVEHALKPGLEALAEVERALKLGLGALEADRSVVEHSLR